MIVMFPRICGLFCLASLAMSLPACAHGIVGERFFPATISTDDPFAADELALPTISSFDHQQTYDADYSKTIIPGFAISVADGYVNLTPPGGSHSSGYDNLRLTPLVEILRSPADEFILSAGLVWDIGGSGSRSVADRFSTYTPEILFGRGLGDLPESLNCLRPLAITGQIGFAIPGTSTRSRSLVWAGAIEYSLRYLQYNVVDVGLGTFVTQLTPLVEVSINSPTDQGGGASTGTINPGLLWSGQYTQLGVEAVIPVNGASGKGVGMTAQLHFYFDDIFPHSLGQPIIGSPL